MAETNFEKLMKGFGIVTVMNAKIYKLQGRRYSGSRGANEKAAITRDDFVATGQFLDTLKIANFTMEGPTKTITGGQYSNPLIKYGKTMTAEIQDALGTADTMVQFFGCKYDGAEKPVVYTFSLVGDGTTKYKIANANLAKEVNVTTSGKWSATNEVTVSTVEAAGGIVTITTGATVDDNKTFEVTFKDDAVETGKHGSRISVTDGFPGAFAIEGETFFIDQESGDKVPVYIFIPQFTPDGIFNLTQDAEGDATVFDLNGTVGVTKISEGGVERDVFYEIRDKSFFA